MQENHYFCHRFPPRTLHSCVRRKKNDIHTTLRYIIYYMYTVDELNDRLIDLSFSEDIGDGDHTTLCCIPEDAMGKSKLLIKEEGILAGMRIAKEVFHRFDPTMEVEQFIEDGAHVKPGDVAMIVTGTSRIFDRYQFAVQ